MHREEHTHDGGSATAGDCAAACPLATAAGDGVFVTDGATGVGRRTFLTRSMLAAAAVALAACGMGGDSPTAPSNVSGSVRVSDYSALANVGGVAVVSMSGSPVAIVRTGASTFEALSLVCPHQGATIVVNSGGGGFTCPGHGARFDANGTWIGGQRTSSMHAYATSYDAGTGVVTVG
ncbi:MAG TPA: Rieske (2Fe-2S) protein [Gemmatimonadaceae bacterium]|nr:Rieske (2Fe-2S) protein [Gemmatimonadaceae bacterium]